LILPQGYAYRDARVSAASIVIAVTHSAEAIDLIHAFRQPRA